MRARQLRYPYTEADIDFMRGVIHHHAQAIVMAKDWESRARLIVSADSGYCGGSCWARRFVGRSYCRCIASYADLQPIAPLDSMYAVHTFER